MSSPKRQQYIDLMNELEKIKRYSSTMGNINSEPATQKDYIYFSYRMSVENGGEWNNNLIGIDFQVSTINVYFWLDSLEVNVEKFLEACSEECKTILLFNLDLIT